MGRVLFMEWLEEEVDDLQEALLYNGMNGLFADFERWLDKKGYLAEEAK